jgi:hypothetical protein
MGTRYTHQVRCKKDMGTDQVNDQTFVDVEVTDAISFTGPNGALMVIDFSKLAQQEPYIIDEVGAGVGRGSPEGATRQSHMEKITSADDSTISLFVEVLDICSFQSPNNKRGILHFPSKDCGYRVDDTAGLGVSDTSSRDGNQTRDGTTNKICADDNPNPDQEDTDFLCALTVDAISFTMDNGQHEILDISTYDNIDTTQYVQDKDGNNIPPDNTDKNVYIKFPDDSDLPWVQIGDGNGGPQLGCAMGPLWQIVNADGHSGPWWIYTKEFQPYEWSSAGYNYCVVAPFVAERCFPYCDAPYECGCEEFLTDVAAPDCLIKTFRWPCIGHAVTVGCGGADPSPTGTLPKGGFATDNEAATQASGTGKYGEQDPGACVKMVFNQEPTDRVPIGGLTTYPGYGGWYPNLWQIVGQADQQPHHTNKFTGKEEYTDPPTKKMTELAKLFEQQWNDTSAAYDAGEKAMDKHCGYTLCQWRGGPTGGGGNTPYSVAVGPTYPSEVADWKFGVAIVDGPSDAIHTLGRPDYKQNFQDFCGGLPAAGWAFGHSIYPSCGDLGFVLTAFHPAYAMYIAVVQLDKKVWDTSGDTPKLLKRPDNLPMDQPWPPA